jgi:hypothetical protein
MPSASELPEDLGGLADQNALEISDLRWHDGVTRLARRLRRELAIPTDSATDNEVMTQARILLEVRDFLVQPEHEPGS